MTAVETKPTEDLHYTDLGNAGRLIRSHGDNLRHVATWGSWYVYDPERGLWVKDEDGEVVRRMKGVVIEEHRQALLEPDEMIRKARVMHCLKSESEPSIRHAILLAASDAKTALTHQRLDADPWRFTCANGSLNLRTGELELFAPGHLVTKGTSVRYDPDAQCPRWIQFLDEVFLGDKELIEFVQRAIGYSMTGDTREHAMFVCYGSGANGKTTLIRVLSHILGQFATTADANSFLAKKSSDGPRNDIARLVGARFVAAAEIGDGRRLDESLVKSLTGGDVVTARFLRQEFFEFVPQFKLWISTNHKPVIKGTDDGIWRRLKLVHFRASFPPEKQDRDLVARLLAEAPGILAWAARGCLTWGAEGLSAPEALTVALKSYQAEQDVLGSWIEDCCELAPEYRTPGANLYRSFSTWCDANGERPWSNKAFTQRLEDRGLDGKRTEKGRHWFGIMLRVELD